MTPFNILYLIQSTDATIYGFKKNGLWERQRSTIERYAKEFKVYYYTSDWINYQNELPKNVEHLVSPIKSKMFGLRHLLFYNYLLFSALKWRNKIGVIRVFGVTIPVLKFVKMLSKKKIVISYQYDWAEQTRTNYKNLKHYVSRTVETGSIKSADFVICTMRWLYDKAISYYGVAPESCTIIPNYVDLEHFYPESKEKLIVFAGRLHWSKGVDVLIKAFNKFSKYNTDYQLLIFGEGEERDKLLNLAEKNELIKFKGSTPINTYAKTLRKAEVFVLPTVTMEGHPKALIEAMASGCKCIASNAPGNIDVLTDCSNTDGMFETGNVDALFNLLQNAKSLDFSTTYMYAVINYSKDILLDQECKILNDNVN